MTQYLLSIYQPDGGVPPREVLDRVMADLDQVNKEIDAAGAWVFVGGLHPAASATVIRRAEGGFPMTDGPYVEGKEHLGGLWVIEAEDLDAALEWGRRIVGATGLPVEVRPFASRAGRPR